MTADEVQACRADMEVVRRLAGWQAIDLDDAFRVLLDGSGDPDLMPVHVRRLLCEVLRGNGYRERLVIEDGEDEGTLMWVRGPWPIDHGALNGRDVQTFRRF